MKSKLAAVLLVAVLGAAVLLGGCAGATPTSQDPAALTGVEWRLVSGSKDSEALAKAKITAKFDGSGVSGFSGVNVYGGTYAARTDGSIEVSKVTSTLIAGPADLMTAEQTYLQSLSAVKSYEVVKGSRLTLHTKTSATLVFEAAR